MDTYVRARAHTQNILHAIFSGGGKYAPFYTFTLFKKLFSKIVW